MVLSQEMRMFLAVWLVMSQFEGKSSLEVGGKCLGGISKQVTSRETLARKQRERGI